LSVNDFDKLTCRIEIKGVLTNLTQLHIGSASTDSLGEAEADNPLIRVHIKGNKVPYIPGSSLKGVFRTFIERIASSSGESICNPFDHRSPCQTIEGKQCIACRIFGSQQIASHIYVSDAMPISEYFTTIKPGIGINRVTGSTQRGALFMIETLAPNAKFEFQMIIENIDIFKNESAEGKLLKFLFKQLQNGTIRIGGKTSSGLGAVKLEIKEINYLPEINIKNMNFEYISKEPTDL